MVLTIIIESSVILLLLLVIFIVIIHYQRKIAAVSAQAIIDKAAGAMSAYAKAMASNINLAASPVQLDNRMKTGSQDLNNAIDAAGGIRCGEFSTLAATVSEKDDVTEDKSIVISHDVRYGAPSDTSDSSVVVLKPMETRFEYEEDKLVIYDYGNRWDTLASVYANKREETINWISNKDSKLFLVDFTLKAKKVYRLVYTHTGIHFIMESNPSITSHEIKEYVVRCLRDVRNIDKENPQKRIIPSSKYGTIVNLSKCEQTPYDKPFYSPEPKIWLAKWNGSAVDYGWPNIIKGDPKLK